jgi:hypothetical protein
MKKPAVKQSIHDESDTDDRDEQGHIFPEQPPALHQGNATADPSLGLSPKHAITALGR